MTNSKLASARTFASSPFSGHFPQIIRGWRVPDRLFLDRFHWLSETGIRPTRIFKWVLGELLSSLRVQLEAGRCMAWVLMGVSLCLRTHRILPSGPEPPGLMAPTGKNQKLSFVTSSLMYGSRAARTKTLHGSSLTPTQAKVAGGILSRQCDLFAHAQAGERSPPRKETCTCRRWPRQLWFTWHWCRVRCA